MATALRPVPPEDDAPAVEGRWALRLYIVGNSPNSTRAVVNLRRVCDTYLPGRYDLEVVDLFQEPDTAEREQVVAVPLLVKYQPLPVRRVVGDLSDTEQLLACLAVEAAT
jgi:circadian clock protein KaiB